METKSRYQVIAELEEKKTALIRERDSFADKEQEKNARVLQIKRAIEDIAVQKEDFEMQQAVKLRELKSKKTDFNFKIKNTESVYKRQLEDAKTELEIFQSQKADKEKTLNELIKGVDESLDRFNTLPSK